jgi:hypothetical protein
MLNITDLAVNKELGRDDMAAVMGGNTELERFSALLDFSTSLLNKVADVNQQYGFSLVQSNSGSVTNNQTIIGGNGIVYAPVTQSQTQTNAMSLSDIGRVFVS